MIAFIDPYRAVWDRRGRNGWHVLLGPDVKGAGYYQGPVIAIPLPWGVVSY